MGKFFVQIIFWPAKDDICSKAFKSRRISWIQRKPAQVLSKEQKKLIRQWVNYVALMNRRRPNRNANYFRSDNSTVKPFFLCFRTVTLGKTSRKKWAEIKKKSSFVNRRLVDEPFPVAVLTRHRAQGSSRDKRRNLINIIQPLRPVYFCHYSWQTCLRKKKQTM